MSTDQTPAASPGVQQGPQAGLPGPFYVKKPVVIQAVQLRATEPGDPLSFDHVPEWLEAAFEDGTLERRAGDRINGGDWDFVAVTTLEGTMLAAPDDFIIRGVQGELYPCKPAIFRATYAPTEPTEETPTA